MEEVQNIIGKLTLNYELQINRMAAEIQRLQKDKKPENETN